MIMPSWEDYLPGEDFTPTWEEYFLSTVMPRPSRLYTDRSGESTFYFNINMIISGAQALRKGGESYSVYKWMRGTQMLVGAAPAVARAVPIVAAPVVAVAVSQDVVSQSMANTAEGKPSGLGILPIPILRLLGWW